MTSDASRCLERAALAYHAAMTAPGAPAAPPHLQSRQAPTLGIPSPLPGLDTRLLATRELTRAALAFGRAVPVEAGPRTVESVVSAIRRHIDRALSELPPRDETFAPLERVYQALYYVRGSLSRLIPAYRLLSDLKNAKSNTPNQNQGQTNGNHIK